MTTPRAITSTDNPRVKAAARLLEHRERRRTGLFLVESARDLARCVDAGLAVRQVFECLQVLEATRSRRAVERLHDRLPDAQWYDVSPNVLARLVIRQNPQGVVAVVEQPQRSLDDLAKLPTSRDRPDLFLVAVGAEKPGNLGAMARSLDAAGGTALLVADAVVDAFNPNAIRASTGAVFTLPIVSAAGAQVRVFLASRRAAVLAATPAAGARYTDVDMTGPIAIVIGPEDTGLPEEWLKPGGADSGLDLRRVAVPMRGRTVDSLNASVCAAVMLFECVRQRGRG